MVRAGHTTGELPGDRRQLCSSSHILQPPVIKASDKLVWLQRLLCGILFSQRVGSLILEVSFNLNDSIILCYHFIISHPESPILTWPPLSAMFIFQGRTFRHPSRDRILLGSACHFWSFDKIASNFFLKSTFPVMIKYCLIFPLSRENSWQLKYSMGIALKKEQGMALFWNKLFYWTPSLQNYILLCSLHAQPRKKLVPGFVSLSKKKLCKSLYFNRVLFCKKLFG